MCYRPSGPRTQCWHPLLGASLLYDNMTEGIRRQHSASVLFSIAFSVRMESQMTL